MGHYLFSVHQDTDRAPVSPERQQQAYADTGVFNKKMIDLGAFVYANGISMESYVITPDGSRSEEPFVSGPRRISGFWILDAPDAVTAEQWAREASTACNEPVEVRAFH